MGLGVSDQSKEEKKSYKSDTSSTTKSQNVSKQYGDQNRKSLSGSQKPEMVCTPYSKKNPREGQVEEEKAEVPETEEAEETFYPAAYCKCELVSYMQEDGLSNGPLCEAGHSDCECGFNFNTDEHICKKKSGLSAREKEESLSQLAETAYKLSKEAVELIHGSISSDKLAKDPLQYSSSKIVAKQQEDGYDDSTDLRSHPYLLEKLTDMEKTVGNVAKQSQSSEKNIPSKTSSKDQSNFCDMEALSDKCVCGKDSKGSIQNSATTTVKSRGEQAQSFSLSNGCPCDLVFYSKDPKSGTVQVCEANCDETCNRQAIRSSRGNATTFMKSTEEQPKNFELDTGCPCDLAYYSKDSKTMIFQVCEANCADTCEKQQSQQLESQSIKGNATTLLKTSEEQPKAFKLDTGCPCDLAYYSKDPKAIIPQTCEANCAETCELQQKPQSQLPRKQSIKGHARKSVEEQQKHFNLDTGCPCDLEFYSKNPTALSTQVCEAKCADTCPAQQKPAPDKESIKSTVLMSAPKERVDAYDFDTGHPSELAISEECKSQEEGKKSVITRPPPRRAKAELRDEGTWEPVSTAESCPCELIYFLNQEGDVKPIIPEKGCDGCDCKQHKKKKKPKDKKEEPVRFGPTKEYERVMVETTSQVKAGEIACHCEVKQFVKDNERESVCEMTCRAACKGSAEASIVIPSPAESHRFSRPSSRLSGQGDIAALESGESTPPESEDEDSSGRREDGKVRSRSESPRKKSPTSPQSEICNCTEVRSSDESCTCWIEDDSRISEPISKRSSVKAGGSRPGSPTKRGVVIQAPSSEETLHGEESCTCELDSRKASTASKPGGSRPASVASVKTDDVCPTCHQTIIKTEIPPKPPKPVASSHIKSKATSVSEIPTKSERSSHRKPSVSSSICTTYSGKKKSSQMVSSGEKPKEIPSEKPKEKPKTERGDYSKGDDTQKAAKPQHDAKDDTSPTDAESELPCTCEDHELAECESSHKQETKDDTSPTDAESELPCTCEDHELAECESSHKQSSQRPVATPLVVINDQPQRDAKDVESDLSCTCEVQEPNKRGSAGDATVSGAQKSTRDASTKMSPRGSDDSVGKSDSKRAHARKKEKSRYRDDGAAAAGGRNKTGRVRRGEDGDGGDDGDAGSEEALAIPYPLAVGFGLIFLGLVAVKVVLQGVYPSDAHMATHTTFRIPVKRFPVKILRMNADEYTPEQLPGSETSRVFVLSEDK